MTWPCHPQCVRWHRAVLNVAAVLAVAACSADPAPKGDLEPPSAVPPGAHSGPLPPSAGAPRADLQVELLQPRAVHHATTLADGRVLVTGGCTQPGCGGFDAARASEIFSPTTKAFTPGPTMLEPRASGTATLLPDDKVLLTGGYPGEGMPPTSTAELFDPDTERFAATGSMATERANHSATLLPDGRVLLCGGQDSRGRALATTEIFDPGTATFTAGPDLSTPRTAHGAVAVGDRLILVGGATSGTAVATTDVLASGAWAPGPDLRTPRVKHGVAALPGDRVLVVGGSSTTDGSDLLPTTEVVNLGTERVTQGPDLSEGEYKLDQAVATLNDGRVVIAGGRRVNVYDPADGSMTVLRTPVLERRSFVTATAVGPDAVLVAGGYDDAVVPTSSATLVPIRR